MHVKSYSFVAKNIILHRIIKKNNPNQSTTLSNSTFGEENEVIFSVDLVKIIKISIKVIIATTFFMIK